MNSESSIENIVDTLPGLDSGKKLLVGNRPDNIAICPDIEAFCLMFRGNLDSRSKDHENIFEVVIILDLLAYLYARHIG